MNPDRRDFLALGVGALAVAATPRLLRRRPRLVRRQIPVMGTVAEVAVLHRDDEWARRGIDAAFAELRRVEAAMTRFRPDSDVGRVNAAAGRPAGGATGGRGVARDRAVRVSAETAEVLTAALAWSRRSGGRFDPCLGGAAELWDIADAEAPPRPGDVHRYRERAFWRMLEVDSGDAPRVRLHGADARIDLGGIAKGYGVDRAAGALRDMGVFHALVNVGGDLVALGADAEGDPWRVGVRSPARPSEVTAVLEVSDAAVATSGDYLQYFQHAGHRYHHLIDPATGEPRRTEMRSLTVRAERCMDADAAATALFGADGGTIDEVTHESGDPVRVVHMV